MSGPTRWECQGCFHVWHCPWDSSVKNHRVCPRCQGGSAKQLPWVKPRLKFTIHYRGKAMKHRFISRLLVPISEEQAGAHAVGEIDGYMPRSRRIVVEATFCDRCGGSYGQVSDRPCMGVPGWSETGLFAGKASTAR